MSQQGHTAHRWWERTKDLLKCWNVNTDRLEALALSRLSRLRLLKKHVTLSNRRRKKRHAKQYQRAAGIIPTTGSAVAERVVFLATTDTLSATGVNNAEPSPKQILQL